MSLHRSHAPARLGHRGFTVLDLLIVLTILGVLFGLAIPAFKHAVARVQAGSARSALSTTLFDALRHATVLGQQVVVCPSAASNCSGGMDWSRGWIAFIDQDHDRQRGPGEQIIRRESALPATVRLYGTIGRPRVVYQPNGSNAGSNITFTLCDRRGPESALALILSNGGRLRSAPSRQATAAACSAGL